MKHRCLPLPQMLRTYFQEFQKRIRGNMDGEMKMQEGKIYIIHFADDITVLAKPEKRW